MKKKVLSVLLTLFLIVSMASTAFANSADVAAVDGVGYETLQEAVNNADGKTVAILTDIALTDSLTIPAGTMVTLDLNGKTVSQTKSCTGTYSMIENRGTLTILDGSAEGSGKISFKDTGAGDPSFGWGSYTLTNLGVLTVKSGTVENLSTHNESSARHMYCAIDQRGGATSTTVEGGVISTPTYRSVRICTGALIITGGEFDGQVWLQPNQGNATLAISGGQFSPNTLDGSSVFMTNTGENYTVSSAAISGGTFETKIGCSAPSALSGCISGGTFSSLAVNTTNPELIVSGTEFSADEESGYSVIVPESGSVAAVGNVGYTSLQDAINAADGKTVTVLSNVELTSRLDVEKKITLDLNGKKIEAGFTDIYGTVYVGTAGNLTITDSGNGGSITNTNGGIVVGNYGTVAMNGGTLTTGNNAKEDAALYNFYYNGTTYGKSTIQGGTLNGSLWNCGVISITGGTLNSGLDNSGKMEISGNAVVNGTILGRDGSDAPALEGKGTLVVSGGTFTDKTVEQYLKDGFALASYTDKDGNKVYGIKPEYTVTFNAGTGTGTMNEVKISEGNYTLPVCGFTAPAGQSFKAWKIGETEYAPGTTVQITEDTTMTALWVHVHVYDQEIAKDAYKVSDATCQKKATYYKSCACGEKGTETFEHGNLAEHTWTKATCTVPATCSVCAKTEGVANGHTDADGNQKCDSCESLMSTGSGTSGAPANPENATNPENPKTSDSKNTTLLLTLMITSGVACFGLAFANRKFRISSKR